MGLSFSGNKGYQYDYQYRYDEYNPNRRMNEYNEDEDDDDEMDNKCNSPCFSFFCPPNSNNGHSNSNNRNGNHNHNSRNRNSKNRIGSRSYNSIIGTPLPDTPNDIKRKRAGMFDNYDGLGLEVEDTQHQHVHQNGNGNGNGNGGGDDSNINSNGELKIRNGISTDNNNNSNNVQHRETAVIHDGLDGERKFMKKYEMCEVLGVGSTSICHRCINKKNRKSFACKIIDKIQIEQRFAGMIEQFHSEIDALQKLSHPNIIKLYDVYTTKSKIYIVMELMGGGELFDYVVQKGTLTEAEASVIVRMVTNALVYMHEQNIIHRDLKPENLLLKHKPNSIYDLEVKIIDFGLSKSTKTEPLAQSFLGTRGYLAPEMLQRRQYSRSVDTWALGVIVFVLLCGCLPFDDDSSQIVSDDIIKSKFHLRFPRWARNLSPSAKDLLSHLLDINSSTRYTAEQAMQHPWICGMTAPKDSMLHSPGRIILTPGKDKDKATNTGNGTGGSDPNYLPPNPKKNDPAAVNRTLMNQIMNNRARSNSLTRNQIVSKRARATSNPRVRQLVRKKSI